MKARSLMKRWKRDIPYYFSEVDGKLVRVFTQVNALHTSFKLRQDMEFSELKRKMKAVMNLAGGISSDLSELRTSLDVLHDGLFEHGLPQWEEPAKDPHAPNDVVTVTKRSQEVITLTSDGE
jgi:hypothetical protein